VQLEKPFEIYKNHYDADDNNFIMDIRRKLLNQWKHIAHNETVLNMFLSNSVEQDVFDVKVSPILINVGKG
jgi:hypothetical protein